MSRRAAVWLYATAAAAFAADRLTKYLAERFLADRAPLTLVPHIVSLNYTTNTGAAFGLFRGIPWLFAIATMLVSAMIVIASRDVKRVPIAIGMGLVLGGALGNLADRLGGGLGFSGKVIDFVDLHLWPVFNVADGAIVVGAVVLVFGGLRRRA